MGILHFRCKDRRRSVRVPLTVPLIVHGQNHSGEKFSLRARSQAVNRHGALLELDHVVVAGQVLVLEHEAGERSAECKVVSVRRDGERKSCVGVEFVDPDSNFWRMTFPKPGARPLRRAVPSKVSA